MPRLSLPDTPGGLWLKGKGPNPPPANEEEEEEEEQSEQPLLCGRSLVDREATGGHGIIQPRLVPHGHGTHRAVENKLLYVRTRV